MTRQMRLDKFLSEMNIASRREIKESAKKGRIRVNNQIVKNADMKISVDLDKVFFDNKEIRYIEYEYFLMNKPKGVVSATKDNRDKTVIDLIKTNVRNDLFPVGRLDKDTEGLLVITNDGDMAHKLLSPSNHIRKIYYAKILGVVTDEDVEKFKKGLTLADKTVTKPADLKIIKSGDISEIELTIYEGKYHQVKRMFASVGKHVEFLKRICMGDLYLDDNLKTGEYRKMTDDELRRLQNDRFFTNN